MQSVRWRDEDGQSAAGGVETNAAHSPAPNKNRSEARKEQSRNSAAERSSERRRWPPAVQTSLVIIATIASVWLLQWAKAFFIPLAVAIFATFWLMPIVDGLERVRIPRLLGAALVLGLAILALGFVGYVLREDARDFMNSLSHAAHQARLAIESAARDPNGWLHSIRTALSNPLGDPLGDPLGNHGAAAAQSAVTPDSDVQSALLRGSTTLAAAAINATVVLFLIYLLLASGDLFKRKLLVIISGQLSDRRVTVEILNEMGLQFQRYLGVLISTNIALGLLTWALFSMLGVEHAAIWGIAAAVLHLIPYLGPAVIAAAAFLVTFVQFKSLGHAFLVASISLSLAAVIGMLLTTYLASMVSNMNSVATFAGLMFWAWLWGIPGLLLGTPIIMATKSIADRVECLHWLGTFLSGTDKPKPRSTEGESTRPAVTEAALTCEGQYVTSDLAAETALAYHAEQQADAPSASDDRGDSVPVASPA